MLITVSKKLDVENCKRFKIDDSKLVNGTILCSAFLYDVKKYDDKQQFINDSKKHFAIENTFEEDYKYVFL